MFSIIRILFISISLGIVLFIMKIKKIFEKKKVIFVIGISILSFAISLFLPVENYFLTFKTPSKAFNYNNFGNVKLEIDGQESTLIIAEESKFEFVYQIIPKYSNGWKLGYVFDTKLKEQIMYKDVIINFYQYKDTNDYYVIVISSDVIGEISDSKNSNFTILNIEELNFNFVLYSTHISSLNKDYWIMINNQKINLNN